MDDDSLDAMLAKAAQEQTQGPSAGLHARVLADFDRIAVRRGTSWLKKAGDWIWPGAALWQPAAALAFSVAIGVLAGTLVPFDNPFDDDSQSVAAALPDNFNEGLL